MNKLRTKIFSLLFVLSIGLAACTQPKSLVERLEQLPDVTVQKISGDTSYTEYYELYFTQPLDHENPEAGTFKQRVLLGHHAIEKPMVVEIQGYNIWTERAGELSKLLDANQLTIEHRYFKNSMPDSLDWKYLNIKQAAADQHKVIQALKNIYQNKWITTGISKGGQTTIYHRFFYPNDVDVSVPYVAPHNLAREDKRIHEHLASVGSKECRDKIYDFQLACFKNKKNMLPLAKAHAEEKGYSFSMGLEKALDLSILEYSFAFWQWGGTKCEDIPSSDTEASVLFQHLVRVSGMDFFDEISLKPSLAFYHQALSQIGMYSYEIEPFKAYLDYEEDLTFDHVFPNEPIRKFNPEAMIEVNQWLQSDAERMLFIYGEWDTWSATAVDLKENTKCKKFVNPEGAHGTRIRHFPPEMKKEIIKTLEKWLEMPIANE
ncbi:S28 family serine protease [Marinifilum caeruleilacunae]|uniref:Peptidase n=1 Tax=Marinifilum caeruleilacunae TaxID=2499076 RepID=A0ABX1WW83_9BACT|nr:S28 family serine protease [Marinifilum caeruleilacunae]NOU60388.1 peptidase [Marinifilum caeruleilacunae]